MSNQPKRQAGAKVSSDRRELLPARRWAPKRSVRSGAESPFWISYADLMTALMVLFLVALGVELHETRKQRAIADEQRDQAVRIQKELEQERARLETLVAEVARREKDFDARREQRSAQIERLMDDIDAAVRKQEGVQFDRSRGVIDFGGGALFRHGRYDLAVEQVNAIRQLVPSLLTIKRSEAGERWLKQIVAEGFADQTGSYLYNLNLSLQRSQQVLCALLADSWQQPVGALSLTFAPPTAAAGWKAQVAGPSQPALLPISAEDHALIKRLFVVGGYSSNSAKGSLEESRRIELRIEFHQLDESAAPRPTPALETGRCALGG